jgi:hypothetical protein
MIEAEFYDLLCFETFRRHVCERFDLRTVYRGGRWFRDVVGAAKRGGVEIVADDLARVLWLNSKQIPYAECGHVAETILSPMVRMEADRLEAAG